MIFNIRFRNDWHLCRQCAINFCLIGFEIGRFQDDSGIDYDVEIGILGLRVIAELHLPLAR